MRFESVDMKVGADIIRIIHTSGWRIFDRGIFIPCKDITDEPIKQVFEKQQYSPEFSFATYANDELKGVLFALKETSDNVDAIKIFILEATRTEDFSVVVEQMLNELHVRAKKANINTLYIAPLQPLSTAVNLRDDELVDTLFKMGYWRDITIAAEMKTEVDTWQASERIIQKENQLKEKGIIFRKMNTDDWRKVEELHAREKAHSSWSKLLQDVISNPGVEYIIVAEDTTNNRIVGYATFFARTIFSELPEFGPVLIDPEYRGMSLSSILMKYCVEMIKRIGKAKQIQLSCYPDKFPVYTRQGYYFTHKYLFKACCVLK